MTGKFSEADPLRCNHYASFMAGLTLVEANLIYWGMFFTVIMMLCISSFQHHKSIKIGEQAKSLPQLTLSSRVYTRRCRRQRLHYLSIVSLCLVVSVTCTALECFALFNIQFCDGEDLIQLYWGFWSVLQVGSNIAIFGVMLQLWIALHSVRMPSWGVALGTPVLVFAALGWVLREVGKKIVQRFKKKEAEEDEDDEQRRREEEESWNVGLWMSRAPTIANNSEDISSIFTDPEAGAMDSEKVAARQNLGRISTRNSVRRNSLS